MTEPVFRNDITVKLIDSMGSDDMIVAAARVSTNGPDSLNLKSGEGKGLINFLMKHRHGTPFEHGAMTFFVDAPIFVFREWHRHRIGFSYNEESGRYTKLRGEFYIPAETRDLVQTGKVGDYNFEHGTDEQYEYVIEGLMDSNTKSWYEYERLLDDDIAKEVARMCLPVNIYSSMYVTCNPRSIMAFLSLRTNHIDATFPSKPMWEIQHAADQLEELFKEAFPITHAAFISKGRVSP